MDGRGPIAEFQKFDENRLWPLVFHKVKEESQYAELTSKDSRLPENRNKNRYRDVNPYDHSRVSLQRNQIDYINANLVEAPPANREYILTQGPLGTTCAHFWLMVWEQNSHAVLMLNRIVEKNMVKCHKYYPEGLQEEDEEDYEMVFDEVGLKVTYISTEDCDYYIIRKLLITDILSNESREILQFHYITWPDFGVPKSPGAFLDFLVAVRASGALSNRVGPPVIHCSAGIGRSGTFCLVDTCLVLIEQSQDIESVSVIEVLMDMRRYRSGLIQTADQLRFSYLAIIEGATRVLHKCNTPDSGFQERLSNLSSSNSITNGESSSNTNGDVEPLIDEADSDEDFPTEPPPPPPPRPLPPRPRTANALRGRTPPSQEYLNNNHHHQGLATSPVGMEAKDHSTAISGRRSDDSGLGTHGAKTEGRGFDYEEEEMEETEMMTGQETEESFEDLKKRSVEIRRRNREDRKKNTVAQIEEMKKKQRESEVYKKRRTRVKPYILGLSLALIVGGVLIYKYYWNG